LILISKIIANQIKLPSLASQSGSKLNLPPSINFWLYWRRAERVIQWGYHAEGNGAFCALSSAHLAIQDALTASPRSSPRPPAR